MEKNKHLLNNLFMHKNTIVDVTHLDEDDSVVIVSEDYTSFYPVKVSDLQPIYKSKEECIDYLSSWKESIKEEIINSDKNMLLKQEQIHYLDKAIELIKKGVIGE